MSGDRDPNFQNRDLTRGMFLETQTGFKEISYVDWAGDNIRVVFMDGTSTFVGFEGTSTVPASTCRHSWQAGMMAVHDDDVHTVAQERAAKGEKVECGKCEKVYEVED